MHQNLYDDWKMRRKRLAAVSQDDEIARLHVQLLDYLLERYRGTDEAQLRYHSSELHPGGVNERTILVHHHTHDAGGGVANAAQAKARVTSILQRSQAQQTDSSVGTDEEEEPLVRIGHRVSGKLWDNIRRRIRWGFRPDNLMERALREVPYLPATAIQHLFQRVANRRRLDYRALELLLHCENRGVYDVAGRAWRERVVAGCRDEILDSLEQFFLAPPHRSEKRRRMRMELADQRGAVRSAALRVFRQIGSLPDVGLLSDLLSLPTQADEYANERQELVDTMQDISHRAR